MNFNEQIMSQCIELARLSEGYVSPNPLVGSIVMDKNGNIAGKGWHKKYGEAHAEVNAIAEAGDEACNDGTIFVSLEPCSHYGKTPPCADLIISKGFKKVIVGMIDPNPKVAGDGVKKLIDSGIEVITGIFETECQKLNEIFIKHILEKKPFISIKTASTLDGKIAARTGSSKWITSDSAREEVQRLRNKYDAILTGSGTIIADNPSLTARIENGRNPVRVIIDSKLRTSPDSKAYINDGTKVIIATTEDQIKEKAHLFAENIEFLACPLTQENMLNLNFLTAELYKKGIYSILVEAGGHLNGGFIKDGLVDKIYFFVAPKILGDNSGFSIIDGFNTTDINKSIKINFGEIHKFSPDIMIEGYLK
ncbi:MAG: bifunctional diaminohydroxyphosphoribosylaminopyrimidine deaminase/5-amino-6-(5-phosphoribosylamino)uracil reductase RibD [bacterium]